MIIECIKEGFNLTNKNWQLVPLRLTVAIINIIGFFIFLGVPVFVAIAYLGMDAANIKELFPYVIQNPLDFVSRYLGLLFLIVTAFIFYLIFSSILFLYTLSGTLGVLKKSALNIQYKFTLSSFFKEAKKYFFPLFRLVSILSLGSIFLLITFSILGGVGVSVLQAFTGTKTSLEVFVSSFLMLSIIVFGMIVFIAAIIFTIYSVVILVMDDRGAVDSIKKTFNFLKDKPMAFLFYIILLLGIIAANLALFIIEIPFNMVPVIGHLINVTLYLINVVFLSYLSIVFWSSLLVFYVKGTIYPVYHARYDI